MPSFFRHQKDSGSWSIHKGENFSNESCILVVGFSIILFISDFKNFSTKQKNEKPTMAMTLFGNVFVKRKGSKT